MRRVFGYGQWNLYIVVVHHNMLHSVSISILTDFVLCFKGFNCLSKTHIVYLEFCKQTMFTWDAVVLCASMIFKFTFTVLLPLLEEHRTVLHSLLVAVRYCSMHFKLFALAVLLRYTLFTWRSLRVELYHI